MAEVYVMTECYATNADSDDIGGYPLPRMRVFSSQNQAIEYARLWVAEDFGDDEAWRIDQQEPRGNMVYRAEIIGPYSTHWVEVQRQEVSTLSIRAALDVLVEREYLGDFDSDELDAIADETTQVLSRRRIQ